MKALLFIYLMQSTPYAYLEIVPKPWKPTCSDCMLSPDMQKYIAYHGNGRVFSEEDLE